MRRRGLLSIHVRLDVGRSNATSAERYLVHLPFSVYLGWVSIAALANISALLAAYEWGGFGLSEQLWASVMICVGIVPAVILLFRRADVFYAVVVDWALLGILIRRTAEGATPATAVIATAIFGMGVLSLGVVVQIARGKVYRLPRLTPIRR